MRYRMRDAVDNHLLVRTSTVRITYDPAKRDATLRERGLDFVDAPEVFDGPERTAEDERRDYPEQRFVA